MIHENQTNGEIQRTELERDQASALGCTDEGKEKGVERVIVRFTGYRCRLLDADNFSGGCKDLLDGLCKSRLLHDDSSSHIIFQTEQIKVQHRSEERTEIEIEYP